MDVAQCILRLLGDFREKLVAALTNAQGFVETGLSFMITQQTLLLCFVPKQALLKLATMPDTPHIVAI